MSLPRRARGSVSRALAVGWACAALAVAAPAQAAEQVPTAVSGPQSKLLVPPPGAGSAAKIEKFDKPEYDTSKLQLSDCPVTDTHTECRNGIKFLCKPFTTHSGKCKSREHCSSTAARC